MRYVRLDTRQTLGAKYNLAGQFARGDIMIHWDDDGLDGRLRTVVSRWRICSCIRAIPSPGSPDYSTIPRAAAAWEYIYPAPPSGPWVAGATFCYSRDFSERHRFPDLNEGADTVFVWELREATVAVLPKHDFYVGMVHARNTSPKRTGGYGWHALPVERIHALLNRDLNFSGRCMDQ